MTELERLIAIEEIKQLKARYFRFLDLKDWPALQAIFTPDAVIDTSEVRFVRDPVSGEPIGLDQAPNPEGITKGAADFVNRIKARMGQVMTVHHGHMPEIQIISPTSALGIWSMEDNLRWPAGSPINALHGYGHYHETYECIGGKWLIKALKITRLRLDWT